MSSGLSTCAVFWLTSIDFLVPLVLVVPYRRQLLSDVSRLVWFGCNLTSSRHEHIVACVVHGRGTDRRSPDTAAFVGDNSLPTCGAAQSTCRMSLVYACSNIQADV